MSQGFGEYYTVSPARWFGMAEVMAFDLEGIVRSRWVPPIEHKGVFREALEFLSIAVSGRSKNPAFSMPQRREKIREFAIKAAGLEPTKSAGILLRQLDYLAELAEFLDELEERQMSELTDAEVDTARELQRFFYKLRVMAERAQPNEYL